MYSPEGHYRPYSSQTSRDRKDRRRSGDTVSSKHVNMIHAMLQGETRKEPSFPLHETRSQRTEREGGLGTQGSQREVRTLVSQRDGGVRTPGSQRDGGGIRTPGSQRDGGEIRTPGSQRDGRIRTPGSQRGVRTVRRDEVERRSGKRLEDPPSPASSWRSRGIPVAPGSSLPIQVNNL